MQVSKKSKRTAQMSFDELRRMVGPDKHRPGPARARLIEEQIPVWAIIGYAMAIAEATGAASISDAVIAQTATDYDISHEAVQAALLYYYEHRCAIDSLLEANTAATA